MINKFVKDFLKYIPAQFVPALVGIITIPIITRLFSPSDYGNYILVVTTVSILTIIVGWLGMSVIRFYPVFEREARLKVFYSLSIKWLIVSVIILIIFFLSIISTARAKIGEQLYHLMFIGVVVFIFSAFFNVLSCFLRAKRKIKLYSGFTVWRSVTKLIFSLLLVFVFGYGIAGLLWGEVFSLIIALPLIWKYAIGKFPWRVPLPLDFTKEMTKYSFPLVMGNLAAWILSLSDRFLLEFFRGSHEVGIYSASYHISEKSILLLGSLFMLSSGPIGISIWEKEGEKKSQEFVSKVARYYLIICLPAVVALSVLAQRIINILTAPQYYQSFRIVPLVALGGFFLGFQQIFQTGLVLYKKTNLIMIGIIASGLLNLGLNFVLIPKYGYMAAAATTVTSYAFLLTAMITISRRYYVWEFSFKSLGKIALSSGVMGVVVCSIGSILTTSTLINLIAGICIGLLVYFLMLFLLREPQKEEIRVLYTFGKRMLGGISR